ncbi:MAG: Stk1 family PASTA domain-containing Ser/Thr kinase [Peptococcaceae bacterium]|nr:Stk1 family PASTA domain-containing Ser/Thr kinase [Peptococcaceae bacterium]
MLQPGTVLNGRYEIGELIGSGGMSLVYRALDIKQHRVVAIKMLREQYADDPTFINRFKREGQSVAALNHPNIVKVYSVCQDGEIYYLVMELIEGQDLKQILQSRTEPYSPRALYHIAAQICDAIAYAHHMKIIHRDIKPHNIIMRPDGQVKVTDFGIARAASEATITHTGSILGTVHYLSPEQAKGEIADQRSDIYSLGVLLYEMATGILPYEGESPISVAVQKIQQDPTPPGQANPQLPETLELVIMKAMSRNPKRRYQSVLQLKDDLREACFNNRVIYAKASDTDPLEDTLQTADLTEVREMIKEREQDTFAGRTGPGRNGSGGSAKKNKKQTPFWLLILLFLVLAAGGVYLGIQVSSLFYKPAEDIPVPDVYNLNVDEALKKLEEAGLEGEVLEIKVRSAADKDAVAHQEPAADVPVKSGSTVRLTLSKGAEPVRVPDLTGMSQQAASVMLSNFGLVLDQNVEKVYDTDFPAGQIIGQDPVAETEVAAGSTVTIVLSQGPQQIPVQSFVGMPISQAQEAAEALGVKLEPTYEMNWNYAKDTVVRQDPSGGSQMDANGTIRVVVSLGPGPEEAADGGESFGGGSQTGSVGAGSGANPSGLNPEG